MNSCEALRAVYFDFYCMNAHVVSHTGTLSGDFWQREINVVSHTTRQKTPNKPPVDGYVVSHTKSVDRYVVSHTDSTWFHTPNLWIDTWFHTPRHTWFHTP